MKTPLDVGDFESSKLVSVHGKGVLVYEHYFEELNIHSLETESAPGELSHSVFGCMACHILLKSYSLGLSNGVFHVTFGQKIHKLCSFEILKKVELTLNSSIEHNLWSFGPVSMCHTPLKSPRHDPSKNMGQVILPKKVSKKLPGPYSDCS
jgi:hypothetical protein